MLITSSRIHGGDLLNMDPGFEAMKKMKPHIHSFWTMHPQIQQLLGRQEVWLTCESMNMACPVMASGAPVNWVIPKEGAHVTLVTIGISKGTKHLDLAYRYINFVLDAETQALNAKVMYSSPVIKNVPVDPKLIEKHMIPKPEDLEKLHEPDWEVVNKERPKWVERWRREISVK
jgi:spermidine/putrescine-binding protein